MEILFFPSESYKKVRQRLLSGPIGIDNLDILYYSTRSIDCIKYDIVSPQTVDNTQFLVLEVICLCNYLRVKFAHFEEQIRQMRT